MKTPHAIFVLLSFFSPFIQGATELLWDNPITTQGAPSPRLNHAMVWTGKTGNPNTESRLLTWGGITGYQDCANQVRTGTEAIATNTGGIWNSKSNTWQSMSTLHAPAARISPQIEIFRDKAFIFGGYRADCFDNEGLIDIGIYDLTSDSWKTISPKNSPFASLSPHAKTLVVFFHANQGVSKDMADSIFAMVYSNEVPTWTFGRFDLRSEKWEKVSQAFPTSPSNPLGMYAWSLGDPAFFKNQIVFLPTGRWSDHYVDFSRVYTYDLSSDRWREIKTSGTLPSPRHRFSYRSRRDGQMLLWHGVGRPQGHQNDPALMEDDLDDAYTLDLTLFQWESVSPSTKEELSNSYPEHSGVVYYLDDLGSEFLNQQLRVFDLYHLILSKLPIRQSPPSRFGYSTTWMEDRWVIWGGREVKSKAFLNSGGTLRAIPFP